MRISTAQTIGSQCSGQVVCLCLVDGCSGCALRTVLPRPLSVLLAQSLSGTGTLPYASNAQRLVVAFEFFPNYWIFLLLERLLWY